MVYILYIYNMYTMRNDIPNNMYICYLVSHFLVYGMCLLALMCACM